MNKILLFVLKFFLIGAVGSGLYFLWSYKDYFSSKKEEKTFFTHATYKIEEISNDHRYQIPELPDISHYMVEAVEQKIPSLTEIDVSIEQLQQGYPKVRSQISYFSDKQNEIDPISIVLHSGVADVYSIYTAINNPDIISKISETVFGIHAPLVVGKDAQFIVSGGVTLKLDQNKGAMIPVFGKMIVANATLMGWNFDQNAPAEFKSETKFRPYLVSWCGSELYIAGSDISYLGYENPKSYGVSYSSCENDKYVLEGTSLKSGTGWIIDNNFYDMYFGFYSYESKNIVIVDNVFEDNIVYGIDPHDRSTDLVIARNTIKGTKKKHVIIVSREVSNSFIFENRSEHNAGTGIMIDRNSEGNIIVENISRFNGHDGLSFYESSNNLSYQNNLSGNGKSGLRVRNSENIQSQGDILNDNGSATSLYTSALVGRDVSIDPYTKQASLILNQPEVIGNKVSNFSLEGFNAFSVLKPKFYKSPRTYFSGELKDQNDDLTAFVIEQEGGITISKKDY